MPSRDTETKLEFWSLGGLSWRELILRTWRESWDDEVFGQAARLSFYHFIGLFPALVIAAFAVSSIRHGAHDLLDALKNSFDTILPGGASAVVDRALEHIDAQSQRGGIIFVVLGCIWAAINGTWALISGLNDAYEVDEERPWWKVGLVAGALTLALAALAVAGMAALLFGRRTGGGIVWQIVHWPVVAIVLLASFALVYRFGPNLHDMRMSWSTPGAVIGAVLWITATLL